MVDTLQAVYAKWEARAPPDLIGTTSHQAGGSTNHHKTNGYSNNLDELLQQGQARWKEHFKQNSRPPLITGRSYKTKNRRRRHTELPQGEVDVSF